MLNILWNLIAFIMTVSMLITVHEFGHFLVARIYGVQVDCFSIGFGKAILEYTDSHNTKFIVALIPLGGYVKLLDDNKIPVKPEINQRIFKKNPIWKRVCIISSGSIANFIFAIFAYSLVFIIGDHGIRPVVGEIKPNSIAEDAKIIPGMELKEIDGSKIQDWDNFKLQLATKIGKEKTTISVSSFGSNKLENKILNLRSWIFEPDKESLIESLGIKPRIYLIDPVITSIQIESVASKSGLKVGDKIIQVNGKPLLEWMKFVDLIRKSPGQPLNLDIEREGNIFSVTLIPDKKLKNNKVEGFLGLSPKIISLTNEYKVVRNYGLFTSILKATEKTFQLIDLTIQMLGKFITGNIKLKYLNGPVSIARTAGISVSSGFICYLIFLAKISVNLGVINLLPFPMLDGGHLIFLMIEKLKGQMVSEKIKDCSYRIGSILLMILMGIALFNDLFRS